MSGRLSSERESVKSGLLFGLGNRWRLSDVCLLLFFAAMYGNRTGAGFDYIFLRGTFAAYVAASFFCDILPVEMGRRGGAGQKLFDGLVGWLVAFIALVYVSCFWSESVANTLAPNYITNFIQALCLVVLINFRIQSREDLYRLLTMFVLAAAYGVVMLLIKTPRLAWGSERVGSALGLNANDVGLGMAFAMLFSLFLARNRRQPLYYVLSAAFIAVALFSGSRKAAMLCIVGLILVMAFSYRGAKGAAVTLVAIVTALGIYWAVMNVPELYNVLGRRIEGFLINGWSDRSSLEREWYREYAKGMFLNKPLLGYGFNGFLTQMQAINYSRQAYSHCNQWELLADLGLIGFCFYYGVFVRMGASFVKGLRAKREDAFFGIVFLVLIFVFDYGYVSFISPDTYIYLVLLYCLQKILRSEGAEDGKVNKVSRESCTGISVGHREGPDPVGTRRATSALYVPNQGRHITRS